MLSRDKENYRRNLEVSFIATLSVIILIFYLYPRFTQSSRQVAHYVVPTIEVLHIPSTTQNIIKRPKPVKPFIPVESEEIDFLDNVQIKELLQGDSAAYNINSAPVSSKELPYTPRQLLDIIPEKTEEPVSGLIILSLRVGIDGEVKDYKVVKNTTDSNSCLQNVIKAALESKWESAVLRNQKVEYWIDKTYRFK
jgi:hypothetical protein